MLQQADDTHITSLETLPSPADLMQAFPTTTKASTSIQQARKAAEQIIQGKDDKLLVVVGPCSIHDVAATIEYAQLIKQASIKYQETLQLLMRVYFEKPRTGFGWKGWIHDPTLDSNSTIKHGLENTRQLLLQLTDLGVASATEFLDTIIPQYIADLISWAAIGARTSASQIHRELASGLSMPVGFKNSIDGNVQTAIDAVQFATHPHRLLGITKQGMAAMVSTSGNSNCHIILRGSETRTNYHAEDIAQACLALAEKQLPQYIMIDCSHGNSNKDHRKQKIVAKAIAQQIESGSSAIVGVMLESNLVAGKQTLHQQKALTYGQSITDACIDWAETDQILEQLAQAMIKRRSTLNTPQSIIS